MSDDQPTSPQTDGPAGEQRADGSSRDNTDRALEPASRSWRRLLRMAHPRATKANLLGTALALLLGFAIATQVHQTQSQGLESLREDELVRLLDDVQTDNSHLSDEIRDLEVQRDQLSGGVAGSSAARAAAAERIDSLGILAGTVAAKGPGISMRISDPKDGVTSALLLDAIEELRDAGAEAIQIDDVRVVASTYFTDMDDGGVSASDTPLTKPYVVKAIGDSSTLSAAMAIPGGVTESIKRVGAAAAVQEGTGVTVDALHTVKQPQYARPVSPATSAAS